MKAGEFSKVKKPKKTEKVLKAHKVPKKHKANRVLIDDMKSPETQVTNTDHNIFGVDASPGHEVHRIRKTHPHLWHKINNWD